jgi:hypothetical protein
MAIMSEEKKPPAADKKSPAPTKAPPERPPERPKEIGGPKGPEPTRYGDWETNGRCSDF